MVIFANITYQDDVIQRNFGTACGSICGSVHSSDWKTMHIRDSADMFWGASFVGFLLGAYALAGSIYQYATMSKKWAECAKN